jgi:hypothetical protein
MAIIFLLFIGFVSITLWTHFTRRGRNYRDRLLTEKAAKKAAMGKRKADAAIYKAFLEEPWPETTWPCVNCKEERDVNSIICPHCRTRGAWAGMFGDKLAKHLAYEQRRRRPINSTLILPEAADFN